MTLQDLFDSLTYGELSQLNIGGQPQQGVTLENRRQVINHIERALKVLHRRFRLKEGRLEVVLEDGKTSYALDGGELPVMKVEHVLWPEGFSSDVIPPRGLLPSLPLNDESSPLSVYTPKSGVMRVPVEVWEKGARKLTVVYRGGHYSLNTMQAATRPEEVEIDLPGAFEQPLLYCIASQLLNPIGSTPEGYHEGNEYERRFQQACMELEVHGWDESVLPERTSFRQQGFV